VLRLVYGEEFTEYDPSSSYISIPKLFFGSLCLQPSPIFSDTMAAFFFVYLSNVMMFPFALFPALMISSKLTNKIPGR